MDTYGKEKLSEIYTIRVMLIDDDTEVFLMAYPREISQHKCRGSQLGRIGLCNVKIPPMEYSITSEEIRLVLPTTLCPVTRMLEDLLATCDPTSTSNLEA